MLNKEGDNQGQPKGEATKILALYPPEKNYLLLVLGGAFYTTIFSHTPQKF